MGQQPDSPEDVLSGRHTRASRGHRVGRTEDGARLPGAQIAASCAQVLGVSADWLLGLSDRPESADALTSADIVWEAETINRLFDEGPDHYTPGSKMPMQRIVRAEDRADLIAFLKQATAN